MEEFLDGPDAETARELNHDGPAAVQTVFGQAGRPILGFAKDWMYGNAGRKDVLRRHAPVLQVQGPLVGGGEIAVARLVDPQAMRVEVGGGRYLGHRQLPYFAERGDD